MDENQINEELENTPLFKFIKYATDTYYEAMQSCKDAYYQTFIVR